MNEMLQIRRILILAPCFFYGQLQIEASVKSQNDCMDTDLSNQYNQSFYSCWDHKVNACKEEDYEFI